MARDQDRISIHDRLGAFNEDDKGHQFEQDVDMKLQKDASNKQEPEGKPQLCPGAIFSRRQKRSPERMFCLEIRVEQQRHHDEGDQ
jgi:hypothetical protein